jgi:hypothetical protein
MRLVFGEQMSEQEHVDDFYRHLREISIRLDFALKAIESMKDSENSRAASKELAQHLEHVNKALATLRKTEDIPK